MCIRDRVGGLLRHHLDGAAGQSEHHLPQGVRAGERDHVLRRLEDDSRSHEQRPEFPVLGTTERHQDTPVDPRAVRIRGRAVLAGVCYLPNLHGVEKRTGPRSASARWSARWVARRNMAAASRGRGWARSLCTFDRGRPGRAAGPERWLCLRPSGYAIVVVERGGGYWAATTCRMWSS